MIKNTLQYFVGKPCTIFTRQTNRNFNQENPEQSIQQTMHYFMGVVESVDSQGIFLAQLTTGLKSYFFLNHLIGISEEQLLDPESEEDAKLIQDMENKMRESQTYEPPPETYINPDDLTNMLKNLQVPNK